MGGDVCLVTPLGDKTLQMDLSGVTFMDSSGLNVMLELGRRLLAEGARLGFSPVEDVLRLTETYELVATAAVSKAV
ncbi:STAS domain-containing protein [Streptomyces sp. SLBN-31]|uniref:STAS domain-containing protein n=1 Tax=Streptomyces sp. SLBN-31 TaxID=2768444 RepID=UPI00114F1248|nr:STAS domain-containing protein [Streptomyces sp. SLBN-31]TQJ92780.1 STAS domain-containing protein [Streptomyces sp. SLBN-31]